jgi:hypothetical protein
MALRLTLLVCAFLAPGCTAHGEDKKVEHDTNHEKRASESYAQQGGVNGGDHKQQMKKYATQGNVKGGEYQQYMDYQKYMADHSGGAQAADYQQYMQKYATQGGVKGGNYQQYMDYKKYTAGHSGGDQAGNYQQYMKKSATQGGANGGDYQQYMDYEKYMAGHSGGAHAGYYQQYIPNHASQVGAKGGDSHQDMDDEKHTQSDSENTGVQAVDLLALEPLQDKKDKLNEEGTTKPEQKQQKQQNQQQQQKQQKQQKGWSEFVPREWRQAAERQHKSSSEKTNAQTADLLSVEPLQGKQDTRMEKEKTQPKQEQQKQQKEQKQQKQVPEKDWNEFVPQEWRQAAEREHKSDSEKTSVQAIDLLEGEPDSDASRDAGAARCCYSSAKDCDSSDNWCSQSAKQCKICSGLLVVAKTSDVSISAAKDTKQKKINGVDSSAGSTGPLILFSTSPDSDASDDSGAVSGAVALDSEAFDDAPGKSDVQIAADEKLAWCRREYVIEKDCDSWVADQMARKAARKADERKRREERRKNEEARRQARLSDKKEGSVGSSANEEKPLMLFALSADSETSDGTGSPDSKASDDAPGKSDAQVAADEKLAWCRREYVSEKDCDSWVADEMARKAARKADERKRREERRKDEEARRQAHLAKKAKESVDSSGADQEGLMMLPALHEQPAIGFLLASVAGASLVALVVHASSQLRCYRNRVQIPLLDDAAPV